jgi:hypothetical protein
VSEQAQDSRPPRGALIVVAVGLLACIAAALLSADKSSGQAANLEWVKQGEIPDSAAVAVPGGSGQQLQLVEGELKASGANVSGYALFVAGATLRIDAGAPVGDGRVLCAIEAGQRTEISRTSGGLRALFPRSSEAGIYSQDVPETLLIDFSARGGELVVLEPKLLQSFTTERGVKLEWPEYEVGTEHLKYFIAPPAAAISCTLTTSAGKATVRTAGKMGAFPPPIDEEAEEAAEELAEEEDEEAEDEAEE